MYLFKLKITLILKGLKDLAILLEFSEISGGQIAFQVPRITISRYILEV